MSGINGLARPAGAHSPMGAEAMAQMLLGPEQLQLPHCGVLVPTRNHVAAQGIHAAAQTPQGPGKAPGQILTGEIAYVLFAACISIIAN